MAVETNGPDELGVTIAEALGLDPQQVRRLIVDCSAGRRPIVYVEASDDDIYDVNWALLQGGSEVRFVRDITEEVCTKKRCG